MSKFLTLFIFLFLVIFIGKSVIAQCENQNFYPAGILTAPLEGDTLTISIYSYAGDYANVGSFQEDFHYLIRSSNPTDFITVRDQNNTVLAFGLVPLSYIPDSSNQVTIHINLSSPVCGTENFHRTTSIINQGNTDPKVGINTPNPETTLDVKGMLKIADAPSPPSAGMMRYNEESQDFEGYDGEQWRSLTKAQGNWGKIAVPRVSETKKVNLPHGQHSEAFGRKMDYDEQRLVVSAPNKSATHFYEGRVYIYENEGNGLMLSDSIEDPIGIEFGSFGEGNVSIKGDYIIVGSPRNVENGFGGTDGSVAIFHKSGDNWVSEAVFTESQDGTKKIGGRAIDICPPFAVASSKFSNGTTEVYIYKKEGGVWGQIQKITNPTMNGPTFFGYYQVHIDSSRLFISDPRAESANGQNGKIYYYENNGLDNYQLVDSILSNNVNPEANYFGRSFSVDGDFLVVGDYGEVYDSSGYTGAVDIHRFNNSNWYRAATLRAPKGSDVNSFGYSVEILGDEIVVGTQASQEIPLETPKAFVFKKSNSEWHNTDILEPSDPQLNSRFGASIRMAPNVIFVSDYNDKINTNSAQGSIYMYSRK